MKTLSLFISSIFLMTVFVSPAQEFVASHVNFSKEIITGASEKAEELGLIRLNDQSNEFSFDVSLFPILSSPKNNDSITSLNKKVNLSFRAQFPAGDIDFLSNDGTERSYKIPGELTINNKMIPVNVLIGLHGALPRINEAMGIKSFPALASFVIEINPADFGLDYETINFVTMIRVEVRNGTLNKSTQNPIDR